jgi:ABC-type uncharacterized transport system auxiliary subunit
VNRRPFFVFLLCSSVLLAVSCINVNIPMGGESSSAVVWTLGRTAPDRWGVSSDYVIRVKDFSSTQILQRVDMIVSLEDGSLNRSGTNLWSARPMEFLPDELASDLMATGAWGAVLRQATMLSEDFVVEGFIRRFGGAEAGGVWTAVLDVDITVLSGYDNSLVFQKNYCLSWDLPDPSYLALATGMASLVSVFNEEVMGDIWSTMLPVR